MGGRGALHHKKYRKLPVKTRGLVPSCCGGSPPLHDRERGLRPLQGPHRGCQTGGANEGVLGVRIERRCHGSQQKKIAVSCPPPPPPPPPQGYKGTLGYTPCRPKPLSVHSSCSVHGSRGGQTVWTEPPKHGPCSTKPQALQLSLKIDTWGQGGGGAGVNQ